MPPSLYLHTLPTVRSVKNGQHFILAPLTLALSPGRGNRFVDAAFRSLSQQGKGNLFVDTGNMLQ